MIKCGTAPYLECSSKGDKRFSAFYAKIRYKNNQSIETLYQAYKVFEDGITNLSVAEAKGKKAINQEQACKYYSELWDMYFLENPELLDVIKEHTGFSDMFGRPGSCCQATEIFRIRNTF